MDTNRLPPRHEDDNPTGCCPRFHPKDWMDVTLHFRDKPFVRAETRSIMHVPLNMGAVFSRVTERIAAANAYDRRTTSPSRMNCHPGGPSIFSPRQNRWRARKWSACPAIS